MWSTEVAWFAHTDKRVCLASKEDVAPHFSAQKIRDAALILSAYCTSSTPSLDKFKLKVSVFVECSLFSS